MTRGNAKKKKKKTLASFGGAEKGTSLENNETFNRGHSLGNRERVEGCDE